MRKTPVIKAEVKNNFPKKKHPLLTDALNKVYKLI